MSTMAMTIHFPRTLYALHVLAQSGSFLRQTSMSVSGLFTDDLADSL